jgi:undecaprenyl-diphosphatase
LLELPNLGASLPPLLLGFVAAFVSGYVCIRFLLAYVKQRSLIVFSIYCWAVGLSAIALYLVR